MGGKNKTWWFTKRDEQGTQMQETANWGTVTIYIPTYNMFGFFAPEVHGYKENMFKCLLLSPCHCTCLNSSGPSHAAQEQTHSEKTRPTPPLIGWLCSFCSQCLA